VYFCWWCEKFLHRVETLITFSQDRRQWQLSAPWGPACLYSFADNHNSWDRVFIILLNLQYNIAEVYSP
jgi:hypothetical protein